MTEASVHSPSPVVHPPKKEKTSRKGGFSKLILGLLFLALIAGVAVTGYMYYQTRQQLEALSTPQGQQRLSEQEIAAVLSQLGKLTLLPDESPVVATIIDADFLATQSAFYQQSQNGDKLVIFPQAKKAFVFSPERNIIVNSGPLITDQSAQSLKVEVRNGSSTPGLGERVKTELEANGATVTTVSNSVGDYVETQVIGINEQVNPQVLNAIATYFKGRVSENIPAGETDSEADVLLIVGESAAAAPTSSPVPSPSPEASATPTP